MTKIGHKVWAIAGGRIPLLTTGEEPAFTSHDRLCILNAGSSDAELRMTLYYTDRDPVGPYLIRVPAKRTRHVRMNDLIDPEAIPLDTDYSALIESNVPVVVQFTRLDTSQPANAIATMLAFAVD